MQIQGLFALQGGLEDMEKVKTKTEIETNICCEKCRMNLCKCAGCEDYFDVQEEGEEIICVDDGEKHYHADCEAEASV